MQRNVWTGIPETRGPVQDLPGVLEDNCPPSWQPLSGSKTVWGRALCLGTLLISEVCRVVFPSSSSKYPFQTSQCQGKHV